MQRQELVADRAGTNFIGIKSIKKVDCQPVYNMEVDGNHNFAVNGGMIVHNCMDATRYFVKTFRVAQKKNNFVSLW